jgi:hypothetical protein
MGRIPGVEVLLKHGVSKPPLCEDAFLVTLRTYMFWKPVRRNPCTYLLLSREETVAD